MKTLSTVNVIESVNDCLINLASYPDNQTGNLHAEHHFKKIIRENGALKCDIESYVEDGYFEYSNYKALLIHST